MSLPLPSRADLLRALRNGPYVPFAVLAAVALLLAAVGASLTASREAVVVVAVESREVPAPPSR